jgi:hypothetical protein
MSTEELAELLSQPQTEYDSFSHTRYNIEQDMTLKLTSVST